MKIKKNLGKRIQEFRKKRKLTQEKLAEAVGIDIVSLSKIETGKNYPTAENLQKIVSVLNVCVDELFYNNELSEEEILGEINKKINNIKNDRKKLEEILEILKIIT